ncbi:NADH-dependent flavin oxidoreductase [Terribacillus sp. DMT04]|uniref:NADH-dependent flavin oxidoreductase n=1 Tax=Terribacillus sp. DMT04 TaxID=2850441 RepID=UPI001C2C0CD8|nr:NADH-dependent flavin oxidoreductase [Terribacillus sp. DMT04]QXE02058.1 NADH-dependent flavin oxidoreductase [Terribacillus sp. DMT04]
MNEKYAPLFEDLTLPNGVTLKNRFVLAPMTHYASNPDGTISDQELSYIAPRSKDIGMVITAASNVSDSGKAFPGQPSVAHDTDIPGLKKQADTIKAEGAKAIIQLHHGGREAVAELVPNGDIVAPSAVEKEGTVTPRALETAEIEQIIADFGEATRRAIEAGFDGVEIHGANGYIIQQFFSPFSNRREDEWGDRLRFPLAVIDTVKKAVEKYGSKDFIIGYRFSPEEPETPGLTMKETLELMDVLVEQPLDYLHVSLMDFHSKARRGADTNAKRIDLLQERINGRIPLIGVGSLYSAEDVAAAKATGVPLIALGREMLIDPAFATKLKEGREDEIIRLIDPAREDHHGIPEQLWKIILQMKGWVPTKAE